MSIIMTIVVSRQILITESPLSSKENREKIAQIVFETFKAPGLCIANSAVMSLFCSGRTRGVTVRAISRSLFFLRSVEWWLHDVLSICEGKGDVQACMYMYYNLGGHTHSM